MDRTRASATAVLVAQGRAVADGRLAVGRFADPTARWLLRDDELVDVDVARGEVPPTGWSARMGYEMLRASAEVMAPRTPAARSLHLVPDRLGDGHAGTPGRPRHGVRRP